MWAARKKGMANHTMRPGFQRPSFARGRRDASRLTRALTGGRAGVRDTTHPGVGVYGNECPMPAARHPE